MQAFLVFTFLNHWCFLLAKINLFSFRFKIVNATTQMIAESREPAAVASPIGNKVSGNKVEVRYTPGILTSVIAMILCKNEMPDLPQAQKYPLKLN